MTDLIRRLRDRQRVTTSNSTGEGGCNQIITADQLCSEAADEIERLRAALTKVVDTYDAYRRRGVVHSPVEYADVIVAIEQARAAMKETP